MKFNLTEAYGEPMLYMNTWANYNENGADLSKYGINSIADGWMTPEQALEFAEEHAEDEPFINDTDNVPFHVGENDNIEELVDKLERFNALSDTEKEAFECYIDAVADDPDEALGVIESGDYYFYPGIDNFTDLAYELENEIGSLKDMVGGRINDYIDEDAMRRDYSYDIDEIMRDDAEYYVKDEFPEIEEGSDEFDEKVEEWMDDNRDTYLDSIIADELALAERGEVDLSNYFDYEQFGRDLSFDNYAIGDTGIIYTF